MASIDGVAMAVSEIAKIYEATPSGFEPEQREPKSLVLPLHYGVVGFCPRKHLGSLRPAGLLTGTGETIQNSIAAFHLHQEGQLFELHGQVNRDQANPRRQP